jgi:hypothetical protein
MENKKDTTNYKNDHDVNKENFPNTAEFITNLWQQYSSLSWGQMYNEYIKYTKRMSEIYYEYAVSSQRMAELYKELAVSAEKMTELYKESAKSTEEMSKYWLKYFSVSPLSKNYKEKQEPSSTSKEE